MPTWAATDQGDDLQNQNAAPDRSGNQPVEYGVRVTSDDAEIVDMIHEAMRAARNTVQAWRRECDTSDKMYAGWQWEPEDLQILREQNRPVVTFNRTKPVIDVIVGAEVHNRQEVRFIPRQPEMEKSGALSELATEANRWAIDNCNGDDERSIAFRDLVARGMGWTEERLEYDEDPDGKIILERVDGVEMWWDHTARKQNLEDAKWVARKKWMRRKDVLRLWPDKREEIVAVQLRDSDTEDYPDFVETVSPIGYTPENQTVLPGSPPKGYVPVTQFQWWEHEPYYRTVDENDPDGPLLEFSSQQFTQLRTRLGKLKKKDPKYVKQDRRVYYQAFLIGNYLMEKQELPVQDTFTFKAMTGFWDAKERIWFGLIRAMTDPQRWANKWLAQGLQIVNSNAKGGLIAETDAFENPRRAEEEWSDPSKITFVRPGGLMKIKEKTLPQFPPAIAEMMQYAITSLREVTGVNIEILGMSEGDQPGVTTRHRQTQGMTILAGLFNALTRYRKEEARTTLQFIREYIADGRLIRIGGEFNAQSIPLLRDPLMVEYDIVIDENPKNPNTKLEVWSVLVQLAPALFKFGLFTPELLDYSPLPASLVSKLKQRMAQAEQQKQQQPEQQKGPPPEDPREVEARIEKLRADALLSIERAHALGEATQWEQSEAILKAIVDLEVSKSGGPPKVDPEMEKSRIKQEMRHKEEAHRADTIKKYVDTADTAHSMLNPPTPKQLGATATPDAPRIV